MLNARQRRIYVHRASVWRLRVPVDAATGEPFDGVWYPVLASIPCHYWYTANLDDPSGIGRAKRPTAFTRDILSMEAGLDVRVADLIINVTVLIDGVPNALYGQIHRVQGEAKVLQGGGNRHANKQSFEMMVENLPPKVIAESVAR